MRSALYTTLVLSLSVATLGAPAADRDNDRGRGNRGKLSVYKREPHPPMPGHENWGPMLEFTTDGGPPKEEQPKKRDEKMGCEWDPELYYKYGPEYCKYVHHDANQKDEAGPQDDAAKKADGGILGGLIPENVIPIPAAGLKKRQFPFPAVCDYVDFVLAYPTGEFADACGYFGTPVKKRDAGVLAVGPPFVGDRKSKREAGVSLFTTVEDMVGNRNAKRHVETKQEKQDDYEYWGGEGDDDDSEYWGPDDDADMEHGSTKGSLIPGL